MVVSLIVMNVVCFRSLERRITSQKAIVLKETGEDYSGIMVKDSYKNIEKDASDTKRIMYICDFLGFLIVAFTIKGFFNTGSSKKKNKNKTTFGEDVEDEQNKLRDPRD